MEKDENGNPIVPSNEPVQKTAEELQAELLAERDAHRLTKEGMTAQIVELREKARQVQPPAEGDKDVSAQVRATLAEANRKSALEKFVRSHKEFEDSNDVGGVKRAAFERALNRMNLADSVTEDDFLRDFNDAFKLSGIPAQEGAPGDQPLDQFAATQPGNRAPQPSSDTRLSAEQEKIRQQRGWTVEKYLEQKTKYPGILP